MEAVEIGDVELVPMDDRRLMLNILTDQSYTWWTIRGVQGAIAYLQAWVDEQERSLP